MSAFLPVDPYEKQARTIKSSEKYWKTTKEVIPVEMPSGCVTLL